MPDLWSKQSHSQFQKEVHKYKANADMAFTTLTGLCHATTQKSPTDCVECDIPMF
jgi:hypothetical protein